MSDGPTLTVTNLEAVAVAQRVIWEDPDPDPTWQNVLRFEPAGDLIATNGYLLLHCPEAVEPFEGEPVMLQPERRLGPKAGVVTFTPDGLCRYKGSRIMGAARHAVHRFPDWRAALDLEPVTVRTSGTFLDPNLIRRPLKAARRFKRYPNVYHQQWAICAKVGTDPNLQLYARLERCGYTLVAACLSYKDERAPVVVEKAEVAE